VRSTPEEDIADCISIRGDKTIEVGSELVVKTFSGRNGPSRVERLENIYRRLATKGVPFTDRLNHSNKHKGKVYFEPRGKDKTPSTQQELLDAIRCVLMALKVCGLPSQ
jgi:hypothetical protein